MIENRYAAILQHDTLKMRHPLNKDKIVTLYRIIATGTFYIPLINKHVEKYEIGGYVESIHNLDPDNPVWLDNSARIFDSAILKQGSVATDNALIFGSAVIENSLVNKQCRVHGNSKVVNSKIISMCEVKDNAIIENSNIQGSCKIFGNTQIIKSDFSVAATAYGDSIIENSTIADICEIYGDCKVTNSKFTGRIVKSSGQFINETLDRDLNLTIYEEVDENTHKDYIK